MRYAMVLRGRLGVALEALLSPISVSVGEESTEVVLDLRDDSEVYGVLDRLERLGIGIVKFEQMEVGKMEGGVP